MEKFELEFRHRPNLNQTIDAKHQEFLLASSKIASPWGLKNISDCVLPEQEDNLTTTIKLNQHLEKTIKGYATYQLRSSHYLEDKAQYDDVLFFEFDSKKINYLDLVSEVIPAYIKAFGAYRAAIRNMDLALEDWPTVAEITDQTGKDIDGRDGVYRINSVNFWDETLCLRAFKKTPHEILAILSNSGIKSEVINNGVYNICAHEFLDIESLRAIDRAIKKILSVDS